MKIDKLKRKAMDFQPKISFEVKELPKISQVFKIDSAEEAKIMSQYGNGFGTLAYIQEYQNQTTSKIIKPSYEYIVRHYELAIKQGCKLAYHFYINFLYDGSHLLNYPGKKICEFKSILLEAEKYGFYIVNKLLHSLYDELGQKKKSNIHFIKMAEFGKFGDTWNLSKFYYTKKKFKEAYFWAMVTIIYLENQNKDKNSYFGKYAKDSVHKYLLELENYIKDIEIKLR